jgi:hypothetical protein
VRERKTASGSLFFSVGLLAGSNGKEGEKGLLIF